MTICKFQTRDSERADKAKKRHDDSYVAGSCCYQSVMHVQLKRLGFRICEWYKRYGSSVGWKLVYVSKRIDVQGLIHSDQRRRILGSK